MIHRFSVIIFETESKDVNFQLYHNLFSVSSFIMACHNNTLLFIMCNKRNVLCMSKNLSAESQLLRGVRELNRG